MERAPSSTQEKEDNSINIWVRMPSPIWEIKFLLQTQTAIKFALMGLPMKNVTSQDVVSAIKSKTTSTKSTVG